MAGLDDQLLLASSCYGFGVAKVDGIVSMAVKNSVKYKTISRGEHLIDWPYFSSWLIADWFYWHVVCGGTIRVPAIMAKFLALIQMLMKCKLYVIRILFFQARTLHKNIHLNENILFFEFTELFFRQRIMDCRSASPAVVERYCSGNNNLVFEPISVIDLQHTCLFDTQSCMHLMYLNSFLSTKTFLLTRRQQIQLICWLHIPTVKNSNGSFEVGRVFCLCSNFLFWWTFLWSCFAN